MRGRSVGPVTVTPAQALWSLCSRVWWDVTETGNTSASWDSGGEAALEIGAWTYFIWGENTWEESGCAGEADTWVKEHGCFIFLLQGSVAMHLALDAGPSAWYAVVCRCVNTWCMRVYVRPASTQWDQTWAVAARFSSPCLPCNEEWSIRLPWRKDMFIQLLLTGSQRRKTDYRNTLVKCQHNAAQVAKRHTSNAAARVWTDGPCLVNQLKTN